MSATKEELEQAYTDNECIWESTTATNSEKAAAWRRQTRILQDPTHKISSQDCYALMKHHYEKLNAEPMREYRQERLRNVEKLLGAFDLKHNDCETQATDDFDDVALLEEIQFEPPCHGKYESCRSLEVTEDELQLLRTTTDGDTGNSVYSEKPTNSTNKNTIANFFQPKRKAASINTIIDKYDTKIASPNRCIENEEKTDTDKDKSPFRTAREMLALQTLKKQNFIKPSNNKLNDGATATSANHATNSNAASAATVPAYFNYGITKKMLGGRRTVRSGFVLPVSVDGSNSPRSSTMELNPSPPITSSPEDVDERLAKIDPKMVELIKSEIMHTYKCIAWEDIAGLEYAKSIIKEAVVYPLLRPDIFTGLRRPPRGILLFGPPGTGKTLIGKCIASQSQSTFFSISASSLTSKWVGDSEKMVRALFAVAAVHQPAVVFIDEVDSLLAKRSESEHDSSRKLKNEFLVQLDGAGTSEEERLLIVGATNRPQELDDAARRRFARRLYIPLPELEARVQILRNLLKTVNNNLCEEDVLEIGHGTDGYSGADMDILCREAAMEPLRTIPIEQITHINKDNVRPVTLVDFQNALQSVRPSVSRDDLAQYIKWNGEYGAVRQIR